MSLTLAIGVLVGLASVYLALSLAATWLQELIAALLGWRSRDLAAAVRRLLDPSAPEPEALRDLRRAWSAEAGASVRRRIAENPLKALYEHPLVQGARGAGSLPSYIPSRAFAAALLDLLARAGSEDSPEGAAIARVRRGVAALPSPEARTAVLGVLDAAPGSQQGPEGGIGAAADAVAAWFDAAMAAVSAWYKRRATAVALTLGVLLALAANADTIRLAQALWNDSIATEAVRLEVQAGGHPDIERLESLGLPLGWRRQGLPQGAGAVLLWVLGILLTALAVAQGSPFWFDVLNRFANARLTEPRPERASGGSS